VGRARRVVKLAVPAVARRPLRRLLLALVAPASLLAPHAAAAQDNPSARPFTYLLRNGTIVDGTGAPAYRGDVAIAGGRIVRVSATPLDPAQAQQVIDAAGLVLAPGFIDSHAHVEDLAEHPLAENFLRQGVTTVWYAPDGAMPWPLPPAIARLEGTGHAPNIAFFAGHNTIRREVMGSANRAPTAAELERMKAMVAQSMEAGAIGFSTGLRYVPGIYSETEEVIELAKVAARYGGFYSSHIRDEAAGSLESVREVIRIAEEGGLPGVVSHHKLMGQPQWGQSVQTLALIDAARARGVDVMLDQYPYDATSTQTSVLFPAWSLSGGNDSLRVRLADPAQRARIIEGMRQTILEERGGGDLARIRIARYARNPSWNGKTFADIARERGRTPDMDFAVELAIEIQTSGGAGGVWHVVDEADVRRIMVHPWTMFSSDGGILIPGVGHPHPRGNGAFARVLGHYVRDERVLSLEEAVRKMTSLPAWRMNDATRGRIAEGMVADIAIFDAARIIDRATYEDPHQYAEGMVHVLIAGEPVLRDGELTGARPGRVLRRDPGAARAAGGN
jgi:N-acyl-D-amino-acid deacylase